MSNLYNTLYFLWRLDITVCQVNEPTNTHTTSEKERIYSR